MKTKVTFTPETDRVVTETRYPQVRMVTNMFSKAAELTGATDAEQIIAITSHIGAIIATNTRGITMEIVHELIDRAFETIQAEIARRGSGGIH